MNNDTRSDFPALRQDAARCYFLVGTGPGKISIHLVKNSLQFHQNVYQVSHDSSSRSRNCHCPDWEGLRDGTEELGYLYVSGSAKVNYPLETFKQHPRGCCCNSFGVRPRPRDCLSPDIQQRLSHDKPKPANWGD